jgi:hypothetical protein
MMSILLVSDVRPQQGEGRLPDGIFINAESEINETVRVGEPFKYVIRVDYRSDHVSPDFRRLLRDVILLPFEQIHRTRTSISQSEIDVGIQRYQLSYSIVAVNVVPGQSYTLSPLSVHYHLFESDVDQQVDIEAKTITLAQYFSEDYLTVPFQALKGKVRDHSSYTRLLIILGILVSLASGVGMIRKAISKPFISGQSFSDRSREHFEAVRGSTVSKKQKIIQYERLILSIFKHYLSLGARLFWSAQDFGPEDEARKRERIKLHLQSGYRVGEPEEKDIEVIEGGLISLYAGVEQVAVSERSEDKMRRQGSAAQRIKRNKLAFYSGIFLILMTFILLILLLNSQIWIDRDIQVFNSWIDSLPERLLEEDNQYDLDILDVQVLGNISEQHRVLENLQSDELRSAYLYNYGTLVAKVFRKIITMPPEDEEDEAAEPPSFEFPLQLLSNAVRFYPYDEDTRRNLEIVILLKENEEQKGSDDVEGELGPPTPGFSRDMNQVLF